MNTNSAMDTTSSSREQRSWTDLPFEILSFIAIRLPILELLSFRGTCKDFRSASSTATAEIQSSKNPWLLFHKTNTSKCTIYNIPESKTYNRDIPDLKDSTFLASYQGWLLLIKNNSIFFFSPFSLSKIPLPNFPQTESTRHIAAFSHPPTSPNCTVSIINPIDNHFFELHIISKGQNTWIRHKICHANFGIGLKPIINGASYDHKNQTFYFIYDKLSHVLSFSVEDMKVIMYPILHTVRKDIHKDSKVLPFAYYSNMFRYKVEEKMRRLDVGEDEHVDVCGISYETYDDSCRSRMLYLNEVVNDSGMKDGMCKAVWIHPRFYELDEKSLNW